MRDLHKYNPTTKPSPDLTEPPPVINNEIAAFTARRAEVAQADHQEFQAYLLAKHEHARPAHEKDGQARQTPITREVVDSRADVGGRSLGRWIALIPTKMGGGTYALDLNSNRVLASIWYWNYGDYNPISHHLCAFPSADPYDGFEFINSTQGGKNSLIYGIPTDITEPAPSFNIYRVRYDGTQMQLVENVSETTGLGLGVHVTVNPRDAQSYFVTDGQKDIVAHFDRNTSSVKVAL
jgi:hypothetical protein